MHFLLGGPIEPSTTPTLVAEPSVVNTEALAMPCNAAPPSSLAALGEEGCRRKWNARASAKAKGSTERKGKGKGSTDCEEGG